MQSEVQLFAYIIQSVPGKALTKIQGNPDSRGASQNLNGSIYPYVRNTDTEEFTALS